MVIVIFGLSISSSWGNGHATIWRGLIRSLVKENHKVVFFERDVPWYAYHRDLSGIWGMELILYKKWEDIRQIAQSKLKCADAAIVTSYCPDALEASQMIHSSTVCRSVFYDLDSPVTLKGIEIGEWPPYIGRGGLGEYSVVMSYTGGIALEKLESVLGARKAVPLYGCVDPEIHSRKEPQSVYRADLSYLGTYASDRQGVLQRLFVEPAKRLSSFRFVIGGAQYPQDFPWTSNMFFMEHVNPADHAFFYSSSSFTLNVTRAAMAEMGYCPSGRLFEAASCGVPVLSDYWEGMEKFFSPGDEILIVKSSDDVIGALSMDKKKAKKIGNAALRRVLSEHTADKRSREMVNILGEA